ncbi:hypothetical protein QN277_024801 [Acacia crassicarpa]|uniref:Cytochrome b561 domain-containing protein n=1 Tax=Acacia crassicarpa TaxID=499986 RepID=A0AAE1JEK5_9FABA|nr:hypothetical protein QN277_024801 [Acacia crassicarpa]
MWHSLLCFVLNIIIIFHCSSNLVISQDSCPGNLDNVIDIPFDKRSLQHCVHIWPAHNLILRFGKGDSGQLNWLLSYPSDTDSYVAIGLSKDGKMVGSYADVTWIDDGKEQILRYSLDGKTSDQVNPAADNPGTRYIDPKTQPTAYFAGTVPLNIASYLLLAIGRKNSFPSSADNYRLVKHQDYIVLEINYDNGKVILISSSRLRRSHGWINMIGWSLLMMIGAIVARHCKQWDPLWFYVHISIQTFAFLAGVVGILCGFVLTQRVYVTHHKNIGILILVLGCLQVISLILRPRRESSLLRKYWNYYHHNVGRILLLFAFVNSFIGLSLGGEGRKWYAGYGASAGILVVVAIILEIIMRIQSKKEATPAQKWNQELELERI